MKRIKRKFSVLVGNHSTTVLAETKSRAIDRAVLKMFGSRCFWFPNSGIPGYGQVFMALQPTEHNSNPGNSSQTNMVSVTVEPLAPKSVAFLKQEAGDREENDRVMAAIHKQQEVEAEGFDDAVNGIFRKTGFNYNRGYNNGLKWLAEEKQQEQNRANDDDDDL